jgi:CheY-like chemotaxis protein
MGHPDAGDRWLRGPDFKPIPIVAVSSFAMKGDEEKARAAGCDHYVSKPYSPMQLPRLIRGFLDDKTVRVLDRVCGSAYMSTRHVKSPPSLFLFFLSFFLPPFLLFDRAARLSPAPTAVLSWAGARRCCQGWTLQGFRLVPGSNVGLISLRH